MFDVSWGVAFSSPKEGDVVIRSLAIAGLCAACVACSAARAGLLVNEAARYFSSGRYELALERYTAATRVLPTYSAGFYGKGRCYERLGMLADAAREYRLAFSLDPDSVYAAAALGHVLLQIDRASDAILPLKRAVELVPGDKCHQVLLGIALARSGHENEAALHMQLGSGCSSY